MEVDLSDSTVQELRDKLGDVITDQLLQKPNEALIAELLTAEDAGL